MLSNEELSFVYKVASDINEIRSFLVLNNKNMSSIVELRKLSFPTADNGGSDDPCCNALDIEYANGNCGGDPREDPCPEGYNKCSGGSDGSWCMPDDGTPCYSYICQQAVCKQVSYSTYLFASLQACQAYCQTTTPDPTLPPPNIFYYKCESGSCIDCSQNPSSCTDKDCDNANYYCSAIKDRAQSNCESKCTEPPPPPPTATANNSCAGGCTWRWTVYGGWEIYDNRCQPIGTGIVCACGPPTFSGTTVGQLSDTSCFRYIG